MTSHTAAQPTAETPPPSSLTVRGSSPSTRAQVDRNHWSPQLPIRESPCQPRQEHNAHTRHQSHTTYTSDTRTRQIPHAPFCNADRTSHIIAKLENQHYLLISPQGQHQHPNMRISDSAQTHDKHMSRKSCLAHQTRRLTELFPAVHVHCSHETRD